MAADLQSRHPNPCKLSPDGHFGSKFVSVVVTGKTGMKLIIKNIRLMAAVFSKIFLLLWTVGVYYIYSDIEFLDF